MIRMNGSGFYHSAIDYSANTCFHDLSAQTELASSRSVMENFQDRCWTTCLDADDNGGLAIRITSKRPTA
jgi:hypothetical protein